MATLGIGTRTLPVSITNPELEDSVYCAVGLTTTPTQPASLAACSIPGTPVTPQTVTSGTTPLNFTPSVNVTANGTYYAWVFVYINGQLYGIAQVSDMLVVEGGIFDNMTTRNVVTSSRLTNTVYTNNTGKPMLVNLMVTVNWGQGAYVVYTNYQVFVDTNSPPTTPAGGASIGGPSNVNSNQTITFIVLPGENYEVFCTQSAGASGILYPKQNLPGWIEVY